MKTILVGLDGSERALDVLKVAADLARSSSAKLVLFRAVSLPLVVSPEALPYPTDERSLFSDAERYLEALLCNLPQPTDCVLKVGVGSAWRSICEAANEAKADLIVVGSHGHGLLDRILGTTAAKVVTHAEASVLVVRRPEQLADLASVRSAELGLT